MAQEQLARHMHSVVYAQRKPSYLQEKLVELLARQALVLAPEQQTLSAANVETAIAHEQLVNEARIVNEARTGIAQEEATV